MAKLDAGEIQRRLNGLPGWQLKGDAISKTYRFKGFMAGIDFINRIAIAAEAADHHPDIDIRYTRITFSCSTHSAGGITGKDFQLAQEIEQAFGSLAA
jgi:4a-hydroxytetrahydrobiopterin dehydratase